MMKQSRYSHCVAVASYLPSNILTNHDLAKSIDTTDEWIVTRTGIHERRIADSEETSFDMGLAAVSKLVNDNNVDIKSIDLLIVATTTQDITIPSIACRIQGALGMVNAAAFDMQAACAGFVYAVSVADNLIKSGAYNSIIIVGVDRMSNVVDWSDRSTCVLFGDGAGAILLSVAKNDTSIIIDSMIYSDGTKQSMLHSNGKMDATHGFGYLNMSGQELFKCATINMKNMIIDILQKNQYALSDIKAIVPHQANQRIVKSVMRSLGVDENIAVMTIGQHGNTSAASIPLALDVALQLGKINRGDLIILEAIGAGLTWGIILLRW